MAELHFRDGSRNKHRSVPTHFSEGDTSCFKSRTVPARLPSWFRQEIPRDLDLVKNRLRSFENARLNTVCVSAHCPNITACFKHNNVTFMILGDTCSRNCSFCAVHKGRLAPVDISEPYNLALAIQGLTLRYIVITSVTRDDLLYGGATQYARLVYLVRQLNPDTRIELLIPDFKGLEAALRLVAKAHPEVIAHNLETVERMYSAVRPLGDYQRSLEVIKMVKELGFDGFTKSGIMLGLGETEEEVLKAMADLKNSSCDILTLGQYLAPSPAHTRVKEFIRPERFEFYRQKALEFGFKAVYSGPLVRSSFHAHEIYSKIT